MYCPFRTCNTGSNLSASDCDCASIGTFDANEVSGKLGFVSGRDCQRKRRSWWLSNSGSDGGRRFATSRPRIPLRNTVVHKGDVFPVRSVLERLFSTAICRQFGFREMSCGSAKTLSTVSVTAGLFELPHWMAILICAKLGQGSFVVASRRDQSRLVILNHIVSYGLPASRFGR
jgi:hypothetical protein